MSSDNAKKELVAANKTFFHGVRETGHGNVSKMSENKKHSLYFRNHQMNSNLILNKDF